MNTECVILAAGLSTRAKANKMLLKLKNKTVIEHCINAFYASCSKIFVVTGFYHEEITRALAKYDKIQIIYNETFNEGMFNSVKAGIKAINAERFFLTPGDYPLLKINTVNCMLQGDGDLIVPVFKGMHGHPILLKKKLIPFILSSSSVSLRECLSKASKKVLEVSDIGVISDLDTPLDYERIKRSYGR